MSRGTGRARGGPGGGIVLASAVILSAVALAACELVEEPADLVVRNGNLVTLDEERPEATALAARDGRIVMVGDREDVDPLVGPDTRVLDLDGELVIPGFIEGHGHFMGLGRAGTILDLTDATRWQDIVDLVTGAVVEADPGEWIEGRGWHQEDWVEMPEPAVEGVPVHETLSDVSPENPVHLTHASGHASFANAAALRRAGIDRDTPDPEGGEIVRDQRGEPTGLLRETAQRLVTAAIEEDRADMTEEEREEERRLQAELAAREALSKGVTTFHDAGSSFQTIEFFQRLAEEGELPIRLYVMVRHESNEAMAERLPEFRMEGHGDDRLTVRSIKRQIDGALGAHGAWLLAPYDDLPRSTGLVLEPVEEIRRTAEIALEHGFQLNTHAIGDRANREVLGLYEEVWEEAGADGEALRWRIEHAQHVHPDDIPRFGELGVIASMQAIHACSDAPWVVPRLGPERAREGAYMWRELLDTGAVINNGTDAPVEDIDPLTSFRCSVERALPDGTRFFEGQEDQRMTREEALRSYTEANAYAAFQEDEKGTLTPGKLADLVVVSRDIMTIPAGEITDAEVLYTVVGGEVVHEHGEEETR